MMYSIRYILLSLLLLALNVSFAQDDLYKKEVDALLAKMTLKEKVGQMTQLTIDMISEGEVYNLVEPQRLSPDKLKQTIIDYGVGSILNVSGHAYTRAYWYEVHAGIDKAVQQSRLKIPVLFGIDAIHGQNYTTGSTLFPQQLGQAATWNPGLVEQAAAVTAYECRASGIPWNFSPVLDLMRQPLWSRCFETLGEDVYLAKTLGVAMIRGYEGENVANQYRVASCMKHFLGYSFPFTGKDRTPAYLPERQLREYFLPTFQAAVDAGAKTVMINSAEMNGIPVHANSAILKGLLRDELGFTGLAVTDWEDIQKLHDPHRIASSQKEAVKIAINAGIDMSMVPKDFTFSDYLVELVEEGEVPMSRIDEAVRRILTLKYQLGLFDKPFFAMDAYPKFASEAHSDVARQAALESITLAKNKGNVLPLARESKVLLTGPSANSMMYLNGAWSRTWQGNDPQYDNEDKWTILEAMTRKAGEARIKYVEGSKVNEPVNILEALKAAEDVDQIVVCLAEAPATEKPGDIESLNLPKAQSDLVKALAGAGKPIILVVVSNRPRIIREEVALSDGVLLCYLPGDEGGRAIADIIYGDHNPEGKLPFTYPRYSNSLYTYDHKLTETLSIDFGRSGFNPQFEFGHGLSYTTYEYSDLVIDKSTLRTGGEITISVNVRNTGRRMGREVIQLYVKDEFASITPSAKRLRGFRKITLAPGEARAVRFTLKAEDLAFIGRDLKWTTEGGDFTAMIGGMSAPFKYEE
ncbi:MAG: glycoside hydrolase family 3 N-terminal domain-containing protein [Bacteroidota bacterium]